MPPGRRPPRRRRAATAAAALQRRLSRQSHPCRPAPAEPRPSRTGSDPGAGGSRSRRRRATGTPRRSIRPSVGRPLPPRPDAAVPALATSCRSPPPRPPAARVPGHAQRRQPANHPAPMRQLGRRTRGRCYDHVRKRRSASVPRAPINARSSRGWRTVISAGLPAGTHIRRCSEVGTIGDLPGARRRRTAVPEHTRPGQRGELLPNAGWSTQLGARTPVRLRELGCDVEDA